MSVDGEIHQIYRRRDRWGDMYELTANDHETSTFPNELVEDVKRIERCEDKQQILNDLVDKAVRRCRNGK